jgi:hypothetical protein
MGDHDILNVTCFSLLNIEKISSGGLMKVFLGVSRQVKFLKDSPGQMNFWCVKKNQVELGDLLLLYFPVSVSSKESGIRQIYRIVSIPTSTTFNMYECSSRGLFSVETELLLMLGNAIKIQDLKTDPVLRRWGAVSRNLQGVTFEVDDTIWPTLRNLIISRNPSSIRILQDFVTEVDEEIKSN